MFWRNSVAPLLNDHSTVITRAAALKYTAIHKMTKFAPATLQIMPCLEPDNTFAQNYAYFTWNNHKALTVLSSPASLFEVIYSKKTLSFLS